jgi:predicted aspartyl protease
LPHFTLNIDVGGPVVNANVYVSEGRRLALEAQNIDIPASRVIRALVDTGASFTSIEPAVLNALNLTPTGTIELVTPSTGQGTHTADTYDVDFVIAGASQQDPPLQLANLRVAACELYLRQGIHALIGRDILERCILVYNGTTNEFTLAF